MTHISSLAVSPIPTRWKHCNTNAVSYPQDHTLYYVKLRVFDNQCINILSGDFRTYQETPTCQYAKPISRLTSHIICGFFGAKAVHNSSFLFHIQAIHRLYIVYFLNLFRLAARIVSRSPNKTHTRGETRGWNPTK